MKRPAALNLLRKLCNTLLLGATALSFSILSACHTPPLLRDSPRLPSEALLIDMQVHSAFLSRDVYVRLVVPKKPSKVASLPVVFLLHGAGTTFRDWTNNSDIASLATQDMVLVMPDAAGSYYVNGASHDRYEDFFVRELVPAVHAMEPNAASDRQHTAIAGISRGGFGAVVLALHHPELFSFVGDISGALDLTERSFRYTSPLQSMSMRRTFGPQGSSARRRDDPFLLVPAVRDRALDVYISCGDQDSLLGVNQRFARVLSSHAIPHELHILPGAHNWTTWNEQMPAFESALLHHFNSSGRPGS